MAGIELFSLFVLAVLLLAGIAALVFLAMLPGRIAKSRDHPQAEAITIGGWIGLIFGGVFWPVVLIWAFLKPVSLSRQPLNDADFVTLFHRLNELETSVASKKEMRL
ncbi:MAG: DUF3302 domain-containing protein [Hoeflea sp.]|uniref:DUF3302 domain-containing protein n=1 Tax=Hoeflea sp. TaxID=1940281 RepID=UPI0032985F51